MTTVATDWVTVRSGAYNGTVVAVGLGPLSFTPTNNNTNLRDVSPVTNIIDQLTLDLSTRLLTDLFSPSSNNTNRFSLNPASSENVLLFETIIRPNNNNSS